MKPRATFGYTLIEMSVVLVVIGLLVGAVLAGRSLIHASELNAIHEDATRYITAMHQFKLQYNEFPGDFTKATDLWGTADADATTCNAMDKRGGTATCNGNGNGIIWNNEMFLLWQHLANAGYIPGKYSGTNGAAGGGAHVAGENCPGGKIGEGSKYAINYIGDTTNTQPAWFQGAHGHVVLFLKNNTANPVLPIPTLTPTDTWKIDSKFDDGLPGQGSITTGTGVLLPNCTEETQGSGTTVAYDDLNAVYRLSYTQQACVLVYQNAFD